MPRKPANVAEKAELKKTMAELKRKSEQIRRIAKEHAKELAALKKAAFAKK